jgi:hypothetical protein
MNGARRAVLNMMGHPTFHDIDSALAEANEMPPEEAAEVRKAAMEAIAGNVRMMLCMTRGSVFATQDCEESMARLPGVYKREVIRSFKEHRPLNMASSMYFRRIWRASARTPSPNEIANSRRRPKFSQAGLP